MVGPNGTEANMVNPNNTQDACPAKWWARGAALKLCGVAGCLLLTTQYYNSTSFDAVANANTKNSTTNTSRRPSQWQLHARHVANNKADGWVCVFIPRSANAHVRGTVAHVHLAVDCRGGSSSPVFWSFLETDSVRGPSGSSSTSYDGKGRTTVNLSWSIPVRHLRYNDTVRARVYHYGTIESAKKKWENTERGKFVHLGAEVSANSNGILRWTRHTVVQQLGLCDGTTVGGVWRKLRHYRDCNRSTSVCSRAAWSSPLAHGFRVTSFSNPLCPAAPRVRTLGLVWSPNACVGVATLAFGKPTRIAMIGDSTTKYLFNHVVTAVDGYANFSYVYSDSTPYRSVRQPSLVLSYYSSHGPPALSPATVIQRCRTHDYVYFTFSEAWWENEWRGTAGLEAGIRRFAAGFMHSILASGTCGKCVYIWGSSQSNFKSYRPFITATVGVLLPMMIKLAHQHTCIRVLDRFHATELYPEGTIDDGTHFGNGGNWGNTFVDNVYNTPHGKRPKDKQPLSGFWAFFRRDACVLANGKRLTECWKSGYWCAGGMKYQTPAVAEAAHRLLTIVHTINIS